MIKFIDLFAGIGGIRLGFEQACRELSLSSNCIFSSEIDAKACETYQLNFNEYPSGDITKYSDKIPNFDFLLAGFPCQPFSYAGKKQGFGDTRGTLFFEIEKIIKQHQPPGFLLENVRGLTTHDQGRTLATILQRLKDLGYSTHYIICNSSNFGIPQNRVRIYILGLLGDKITITQQSDVGAADSHTYKNLPRQFSLFDKPGQELTTVKDILEKNPDPKYNCSPELVARLKKALKGNLELLHGIRFIDYRGGHSLHSWDLGIKGECTDDEKQFMNALIANRRKKIFGKQQDGKNLTIEQIQTFFNHPDTHNIINSLIKKGYLKEINSKYKPVCGNMSFEVFKFLDPESISITLTTADAHKLGVFYHGRVRKITPRECARLQGFPDTFLLHPEDNFAYRQLGNTVTVPVVKELIVDLLKNNSHLFSQYQDNTAEARKNLTPTAL